MPGHSDNRPKMHGSKFDDVVKFDVQSAQRKWCKISMKAITESVACCVGVETANRTVSIESIKRRH
ncbi:MAG: hypothetical protein GY820_47915 [Gammaproteobacteria bacterium]|nr:hypothetical protein [Gammaproteobacteria bacterium]